MNKVNLNNTFLTMATNDQNLISMMKETIEYQRGVNNKRTNLMKAITHNVKYLAIINESNSMELKVTKERLVAINAFNERLQDENSDYKKKNEILLEDQRMLAQKREEMAKMIIESQANSKEIE